MSTPDDPPELGIDYPRLAQEALRDVARLTLEQIAREGLPGEHHLYLSFKTRAPGVHLSPFLLDMHPEEMTIILQNQFWDLVVDREAFSVTLAFGGRRHSMTVPFSALAAMVDPSVPFGLRWDLPGGDLESESESEVAEPSALPEGSVEEGDEPSGPGDSTDGKVVRIDRFRRTPGTEGD